MQPSLVTRATAVEKSAEDVKWKEVIKLYDEQKPYQVKGIKMYENEKHAKYFIVTHVLKLVGKIA